MERRYLKGILGSALVAAVVLGGCSSGATTTGGPSGGEVQLTMVETLTSPERTPLIRQLLDTFEASHPNIKVNLVSPPTESGDQKLQQMLTAGNGVDVMEVRDITVGPYVKNNWVYDMAPDLKNWAGWSDITDSAKLFALTKDGKSYYIPYGFYALTMFYRSDWLKEVGYSAPPKTWDELATMAKKINDPAKNRYGDCFRGGPGADAHAAAVIESYLANKIDPANAFRLKDGGTIFSTPEALQAMNVFVDVYQHASPPSALAWGYPEMVQGFTSGTCGFLLQTSEVIATVRQSATFSQDAWGTTPIPLGASGFAAYPLGATGWGVAQSSQHKAEAVQLVEYLSSGDAALKFALANTLAPNIKSASSNTEFTTGPFASYVEMAAHPDTYITVIEPRQVAWWPEWQQKSVKEFDLAVSGTMDVKSMLAGWDKYWTDKWAANP